MEFITIIAIFPFFGIYCHHCYYSFFSSPGRLCKLEKRGDEIKKKSSPQKLLSQYQPNFAEMILGWPPFQNCVRWSRLPNKMAAKLKIEKRGDEILIVHCCFSVSQQSSNFNCSYMARNSLTYIPNFSVKFFFQPIYTDYAN